MHMSRYENNTSNVEQPFMSTGTPQPGFKKEEKGKKKPVNAPKIGETIMGDDGMTGRNY